MLNNSIKTDFDFSTTKNDAKEESDDDGEEIDPNDDNNKQEKEEIVKKENHLFIKDIPHLKNYDYETKKFVSKGEGRISIEKYTVDDKEIFKLIMRNPKSKLIFFSGNIIEKKTSINVKNEKNKFVLSVKNLMSFEQEQKKFFVSSVLIKFHNEKDENEFINVIKKIIN